MDFRIDPQAGRRFERQALRALVRYYGESRVVSAGHDEHGEAARAPVRDLRLELHAAGRTHVTREIRPLAEINEAIADVEAANVPARIVFEP